MEKQELLEQIELCSSNGLVSRKEVIQAFDRGASGEGGLPKIFQLLAYLGGGIVVLGVGVFGSQFWSQFSDSIKILLTLGMSLACYSVAYTFSQKENLTKLALGFFFIFCLLFPWGISQLFEALGYMSKDWTWTLHLVVCGCVYLTSFLVLQRNLFLFFYGLTCVVLCYVLADWLGLGRLKDFEDYLSMFLGFFLGGLGYLLSHDDKRDVVVSFMYFFGSAMGLVSGFILLTSDAWKSGLGIMAYGVVLLGSFYASVGLKSRSYLAFSSIGLVAFIYHLTDRYFKTALGWPFVLVITGLSLMAVSFFSYRLFKKNLS